MQPLDPYAPAAIRTTFRICVDASVLVAALVGSGPGGEWAEGVVAAGSLYAPDEGHTLGTSAMRFVPSLGATAVHRRGSC